MDGEEVIEYKDLPEGHLFRLISKGVVCPLYSRQPEVDWSALLARLQTPDGIEEARQWVKYEYSDKSLFLHALLDFDFGDDFEKDDPSVYRDAQFMREQFGVEEEDEPEKELLHPSILLQVVHAAMNAYPEAVHLPNAEGYYPLHLICRCGGQEDHRRFPKLKFSWRRITTTLVFRLVLLAHPEVATIQVPSNGRTALHFLCGFNRVVPMEAVQAILRLYPNAIEVQDKKGRYPLHTACESASVRIVQTLLELYPEACYEQDNNGYNPLHIACENGRSSSLIKRLLKESGGPRATFAPCGPRRRTPLLSSLEQCRHASDYQVPRHLLESCPLTAAIADRGEISIRGDWVEPAGDALDYICVIYCNAVLVRWYGRQIYDEFGGAPINDDFDDFDSYSFINGNIDYLEGGRLFRMEEDQEFIDATFEMLLIILRVMYGRGQFLPLHAICHGILCRPWNLVVLQELISRFGDESREKDSSGSLPLHLFLESCSLEGHRAIDLGYASDDSDYQHAIERSYELILNANPRAALVPNGEDRLPLHLTIANRGLSNDAIMDTLVTPLTVRARDITNRLYPFACAAIGVGADVDLTFRLLRKDPSVMRELVASE